MMRIVVLAALLAGCATTRPAAAPPIVMHTAPLAGVALPAPPAPLGPRPDSLSAAADALLAQVCRLSAYVIQAVPLLGAAKGETAAAPLYPECEPR